MTETHTPFPELLPCPFCGGEAEIVGRNSTSIRCTNDQCISRHDMGDFNDWGHREAATTAWNARPSDSPDRLIEVLEKIATVDEAGLAEYTPQAMVTIARAALKEAGR